MRFAVAATLAGLSAVAVASDGWSYGGYGPPPSNTSSSMTGGTTAAPVMPEKPSYTTEVVTEFTTYCPESTQITHGGVTYTVTEATTLTITNCPCTVTKPVYSAPSSPVAPPYPSGNATTPVSPNMPPVMPTGTGAYVPPSTTSPIVPGYTGAASKASFGVILAAAGFIAAL
ncbi:Clock-controlled protein 6 [Pseudocercospora fuligena]|uniref:Clock-controlled protein 6 n=1 Tax=Pseudocercospora fuligena TaxID=685502 RepID=A0A8H6VL84_9PEZI|nr:Clock-controlled protein 6 [Pseudocercospora fuligena]